MSLFNFDFCIFSHLINYAKIKSNPNRQNSKIDFIQCVAIASDSSAANFQLKGSSFWRYFGRGFKIGILRKKNYVELHQVRPSKLPEKPKKRAYSESAIKSMALHHSQVAKS